MVRSSIFLVPLLGGCVPSLPAPVLLENPDHDYDGDDYTEDQGDCDDADAAVSPGAAEICDGSDNNCDDEVDEYDPDLSDIATWHPDDDGDGYGSSVGAYDACKAPPGYVADGADCDDSNAGVSPAAAEICENGVNDNCSETPYDCGWSHTTALADASAIYYANDTDIELGRSILVADIGLNEGYEILMGAPRASPDDVDIAGALYSAAPLADNTKNIVEPLFLSHQERIDFGFDLAWLEGEALLVAAPARSSTSNKVYITGEIFVFELPIVAGGSLEEAAPSSLLGENSDDWAGYSLDARSEEGTFILVGAPRTGGIEEEAGRAYLVQSLPEGEVDLATVATLRVTGEEAGGHTGWAVALADLDGNGVQDIVVSSPGVGSDAGAVHVVWGEEASYGDFSLADADQVLMGETYKDKDKDERGTKVGESLANVGDLDGDDRDDLLVGAVEYPNSEGNPTGAAYLLRGSDIEAGKEDAVMARLEGVNAGDTAGFAVAGGEDFNGDGSPDIAVGARGESEGNGAVYIVYGQIEEGVHSLAQADLIFQGEPEDRAGSRLAFSPDLDGDDQAELLVGATQRDEDPDDTDPSGRVYLLLGGEGE